MHSAIIRRQTAFLVGIVLWCGPAWAKADVRLNAIKDPSIQCDYLVVTPGKFMHQAKKLAEHRNSWGGDDVTFAGVVDLAQIYSEFRTSDTMKTFDAIHRALVWAYNNWQGGFRYLVLVGDDSACTQSPDTTQWTRGPMPSYTFRVIRERLRYDPAGGDVVDTVFDTSYTFSDSYYLVPSDSMMERDNCSDHLPVALGRIPCESEAQCSLYVERVISMDTRPQRGPWMNRAILIADDAYQGLQVDHVKHVPSCEEIDRDGFQAYFTRKLYTAEYGRDVEMHHVLAGDDYFSSVNDGALWTVYFGHGHESLLSDETVIAGREAFRLRNGEKRGVFCSFSCSNGAYDYPFGRSMCKQFLFAGSGGYMIYIGATADVYATANTRLASAFFRARDSVPAQSCGMQFRSAVMQVGNDNSMMYSFLGDPAFRPSGRCDSLSMTVDGQNVLCAAAGIGPGGTFTFKTVRADTVVPMGDTATRYIRFTTLDSGTGAITGNFFSVPRASASEAAVRLIVYAWNDSVEARNVMTFGGEIPGPGKRFIAQKSALRVYSVSNTGILVGGHRDELSVCVKSIDGRTVYRRTIAGGARAVRIDSRQIPPGIYLVEIKTPTRVAGDMMRWMKIR